MRQYIQCIQVDKQFAEFYVCDPNCSKWYETHDPTMERAVASDIYCKLIKTNAYSGALHNTVYTSVFLKMNPRVWNVKKTSKNKK